MDLAALFKEETVRIPLEAKTKTECIEKMAGWLLEAGALTDKESYIETVLRREQQGTTGIGFKVAIPHGKSKSVKEPCLAFARLKEPVQWQSLDGDPVSLVFLIAVPEKQAGTEHLQILAAISRKLIHEEFRDQLMNVQSYQDLIGVLRIANYKGGFL